MKINEVLPQNAELRELMDYLDHNEFKELLNYVIAPQHHELSQGLRDHLLEFFKQSIPYGVLKGRDGDPDEWLASKLEEIFAKPSSIKGARLPFTSNN